MIDIIIKDSNINGRGIFANRDFNKDEIVIKHKFKILNQEEYHQLPDKEKHFVGKIKKEYKLSLPPSRFVNHSCEPNTKIKNNSNVATRDIKKGEEITTYYEDDDPNFKMECNCGNKNCRKIITNKN